MEKEQNYQETIKRRVDNENIIKNNKISEKRDLPDTKIYIGIFFTYLLFVLMLLVNIYLMTNISNTNKLMPLFLSHLVISYLFFYFLISTLSAYFKYNVLYRLLHNKLKFASLVLGMDASATIILIWMRMYKDKQNDASSLDIIIGNSYLILIMIITFTLVLFKNIIGDLLNFKMHKNNYELRLDEHSKTGFVLKVLDTDTGISEHDLPKIRGQKIFKKLQHKQVITKETLSNIYEEDIVELIFATFNLNQDHKITEDEFVKTYSKIMKQRYDLLLSLNKKDDLLRKFDILLSCIFVPLGLVIYEICISMSFDKISVLRYFQTLLSLNFIFGALAQDIFKSLNFILNVRIFDVGDFLELDGKIHIVKDIGLLYSTFEVDSKTVIIANSKLMSNDIVNYRLTKEKKRDFIFSIQSDVFIKNEKSIRSEIRNLILEKRAYISRKYSLNILDQSEDTKNMRISVGVTFKLSYQNIYQIQNEENEFLASLAKTIKLLNK